MANKPFFDIRIDEKEFRNVVAWLDDLSEVINDPIMYQAILDGAIIFEKNAKKELKRLVYDVPTSSDYVRTGALFNETTATGKVNKKSNSLTTGVKTHVGYGVHVHQGLGPNRKYGPRPYMTNAGHTTTQKFKQLIKNAVFDIARRKGK